MALGEGGLMTVCSFDICAKHGKQLHGYPCHDCQAEWQETHPKSHQAIADFVAGGITIAELRSVLDVERAA